MPDLPATFNVRFVFAFLCLAGAAPAVAQTESWPLALRNAMQRTATVEWRLHEAAGQSCPTMSAATGLVLDSLDSYNEADRAMIARSLELSDALQVAAIAGDSPAARAGIRVGDDLLAVNDAPILSGTGGDTRPWALDATQALAALPPGQPMRLTLRRGGATFTVPVIPESRCASRIFVDTKNALDAYTDGADIIITARMVDFTGSDDELAILAGHELGHVIARDGEESGIGERRRMEDRADVVGADLAACAGYDTKAAAPFWRRFEKTRILRFVAIRLQSSGQARVRNVQARAFPQACPITGVPPLRQ